MHTAFIFALVVIGFTYPGASLYTTILSVLVLAHQLFSLMEDKR
jgi:hypothetical protein